MFEYADHDPAINHTLVTHYCQQLTFTSLHLSKQDCSALHCIKDCTVLQTALQYMEIH